MAQFTISSQQTPKEIRWKSHGSDLLMGGTLAADNGTTGFATVAAGTILGRITSNGKLRPCAKQSISNTGSSNTPQMTNADNFFVSDTVRVVAGTGTLGTATLDADGAGNLIEATGVAYDGVAHTTQLVDPGVSNSPLSVDVDVSAAGVAAIVANLARGPSTLTIVASGSGDRIDVEGRDGLLHTIQLLDPSATDQALAVTVTYAESGLAAIVVSLATDGGGSITSTVTQVIAALNGEESGSLVFAELRSGDTGSNTAIAVAGAPLVIGAITSTVNQVITALQNSEDAAEFVDYALADGDSGAGTAVAVGATPLAGGVVAGATKATGRSVTAVDKSSTPNTVTFDGAAVVLASGDYIEVYDGSQTPVGILERGVSTLDLERTRQAGAATYSDVEVVYGVHGMFKTSELVGLDSLISTALGATNDGTRYYL